MAIGDIITGRLDRSVTGTGSWVNQYRPASGVEVIILNIILEVDFPTASGTGSLDTSETAMASLGLDGGTDVVVLDTLSVTGTSGPDHQSKIVASLGTPMKLPVTNSVHIRLDSSLTGGAATGNFRLWYTGIQTK